MGQRFSWWLYLYLKKKEKKTQKKHKFDEFHLLWFILQEELLNGCKDLCEKIIKPKLKDYFKEMPKTPFE